MPRCGHRREPGPVKVKSRGSTALSKFFPSLTPARRGLFFQTSQGRNGIRARPRAAPRRFESDPTAPRANTVTRTHACRCERRRNVAHHQNCTHFCTVKVLKRTPKANAERDSVRAPSRKPGLCGSGAPLGAALAACLTGGATTGTRTERWARQSTGCCHTPRVEREFLKAQP